MRIPKTLTIRGRKWRVKLVHGLEAKHGALGFCSYDKQLIEIDADQNRTGREVTFIHELLHAVWPNDIVGDRTEERLIEAIDEILHDALKRNKI